MWLLLEYLLKINDKDVGLTYGRSEFLCDKGIFNAGPSNANTIPNLNILFVGCLSEVNYIGHLAVDLMET